MADFKKSASLTLSAGTKKMLEDMKDLITTKDLQYAAGEGADLLRNAAKRKVPVKTGNLKKAIYAKVDINYSAKNKNKVRAYVTANYAKSKSHKLGYAPYAHLVEFGGRSGEMPARPFMRPARDANISRVRVKIESGIMRRLKKKLSKYK